MNAKDNDGSTALHKACRYGKPEIVELIIQSSKDFGIDLNAKDCYGSTAWHRACIEDETETVQMILKNWKEFGIDLKAQDNQGITALDLLTEEYDHQIKEMLEN